MPEIDGQATHIELRNFKTPHMRAFHLSWLAFFLCFFGWFGIAPLMALVREDLQLSRAQVSNTVIASVALTVVARILVGWLCDRIGPRLAYTWLLMVGSLPVMAIGLSDTYETFLLFRLAIGLIGASFVITQYHTSVMFAPRVVGTTTATVAGWGNLGGGVAQMLMPLLLAQALDWGLEPFVAWRAVMIVPGAAMLLCGLAYFFWTQDAPQGNFRELQTGHKPSTWGWDSFGSALKDWRVWSLFLVYGACFGIELMLTNVLALYYHDRFSASLTTAGLLAGLFGLMNVFARSLGGWMADRMGMRFGLRGRAVCLGALLLLEGLALQLFSHMSSLYWAVAAMILFALLVKMASGATYAVVPFINRTALGVVSGIVAAGGNAGAVGAGLVLRWEVLSTQEALFWLGLLVCLASIPAFRVRCLTCSLPQSNRGTAHRRSRICALCS